MSGETADSEKPFRHLPHVVPPQSGDIHGSYWILRKVERPDTLASPVRPATIKRLFVTHVDIMATCRLKATTMRCTSRENHGCRT